MGNAKKKVKKTVNNENKDSKNISDSTDEEKIQKAIKDFEFERRKQFEETLMLQKQSVERRLRGEVITTRLDNTKNYFISFCIFSSRIKEKPIWIHSIEVTGKANEFDFVKTFTERVEDYFNSKEFKVAQKQKYHKLRKQGVKFTEIYPQIEPRYLMMDRNEKLKFRKRLTKGYTRKRAKQKGNKNSDLSPSSE
jgi:hypothetical protein